MPPVSRARRASTVLTGSPHYRPIRGRQPSPIVAAASDRQRNQVHRGRRGDPLGNEMDHWRHGRAAVRSRRHRHRHSARQAAADLRAVRADRRLDDACLRRYRTWAHHLGASRRDDGRHHLFRKRPGVGGSSSPCALRRRKAPQTAVAHTVPRRVVCERRFCWSRTSR
jgi:hypothetical protein